MIYHLSTYTLYLILGAAGGFTAALIGIPGGFMIGAMLFTGMARILLKREDSLPKGFRRLAEVLLGINIGLRITSEIFQRLGSMSFVVITLVFVSILSGVVLGYVLAKLAGMDLITSLFSFMPGASLEMTSAAGDQGGNMGIVASIQTFRVIMVVSIVPFLLTFMGAPSGSSGSQNPFLFLDSSFEVNFILVLLVGMLGAWIGITCNIPGGGIIGSMVFVGMTNFFFPVFPPLNGFLRVLIQVLLGTFIGGMITAETLKSMFHHLKKVLSLIVLLIVIGFGLGYLFSVLTGVDLITAAFSMAPGGIAEMTAAAESLGGEGAIVASVHLVRITFIIFFAPILIKWMLFRLSKTKKGGIWTK